MIKAFKGLEGDYKLVIAGDAGHETEYSMSLRHMASEDDRIILTGYITGEPLNQVYTHARLFVLPSYHEGLPIVLLEAMSYVLPVLVSDIPANKEVELPAERYFRCGDVDDLRPLHNPSIVIASEAKQSHNTLISHPPECFGGPRRFAPRNDQNWAKMGVMQRSRFEEENGSAP